MSTSTETTKAGEPSLKGPRPMSYIYTGLARPA